MQEPRPIQTLSGHDEFAIQGFMTRTYLWMALGLAATGALAYYTAHSEAFMAMLFGQGMMPFFILAIAELGIVFYLSARIMTLAPTTASVLFFVYAALNGLTIAPIFLAYTEESLASAFFSAAAMFGVMSFYGATTKRDLSGWGSFLMMGLIGLIIASLINLFVKNSMADWVISVIGVIVFTGLAAFDTQKLRRIAGEFSRDDDAAARMSILGALTLYLDFINMFLFLLRIMGRRK